MTARPPPGMRTRSPTSATVPTLAYSPSCRGTSSTRSSSPTSTAIVTFMFGKTTRSSSGTRSNELTMQSPFLSKLRTIIVASTFEVPWYSGHPIDAGQQGWEDRRMSELDRELEDLGVDITSALEELPVPAVLLDADGVVRWQNAAGRAFWGDVTGAMFTDFLAAGQARARPRGLRRDPLPRRACRVHPQAPRRVGRDRSG